MSDKNWYTGTGDQPSYPVQPSEPEKKGNWSGFFFVIALLLSLSGLVWIFLNLN